MFDFFRWMELKKDVPPGTLVFAGEVKDFTPRIIVRSYGPDSLDVREARRADEIGPKTTPCRLIHVTGVHETDMIREIGAALDLPVLALEDVMNTSQRSKIAWQDDETGFIVMKSTRVEEMRLASEQVSIFWREGGVAVFTENEGDLLDGIARRLEKAGSKIRNRGSEYLLAAVLDALVDRQLMTLGKLGELAENLEEELMDGASDDLLGRIYTLKRETILLRNTLLPVGDIFKDLLSEESEFPEESMPYLRDVADHSSQAAEGSFALHDILTSMIDYQISIIGIHTNKVMQHLTVIATIFIPLTFIAGLYGMNFDNMPELHWPYGYFIALGAMAAVGVGMAWYFIRKKML